MQRNVSRAVRIELDAGLGRGPPGSRWARDETSLRKATRGTRWTPKPRGRRVQVVQGGPRFVSSYEESAERGERDVDGTGSLRAETDAAPTHPSRAAASSLWCMVVPVSAAERAVLSCVTMPPPCEPRALANLSVQEWAQVSALQSRDLVVTSTLSSGAFGAVLVAVPMRQHAGEPVVVKAVPKLGLRPHEERSVLSMPSLLHGTDADNPIRHKYVCSVLDAFEDADFYFHVFEYLPGGDLYSRLEERGRPYTEAQALFLLRQILFAAHFLHSRNLAHRDIKLENFVFLTMPGDKHQAIKLIDFDLLISTETAPNVRSGSVEYPRTASGTIDNREEVYVDTSWSPAALLPQADRSEADSLFVHDSDSSVALNRLGLRGFDPDSGHSSSRNRAAQLRESELVGTTLYISPAIANGQPHVPQESDMWAIGVVFYTLLTFEIPFHAETHDEVLYRIRDYNPSFSSEAWANVSPDTVALARALLNKNAAERPSAQDALMWTRRIQASMKGDSTAVASTLSSSGSYTTPRKLLGRLSFTRSRHREHSLRTIQAARSGLRVSSARRLSSPLGRNSSDSSSRARQTQSSDVSRSGSQNFSFERLRQHAPFANAHDAQGAPPEMPKTLHSLGTGPSDADSQNVWAVEEGPGLSVEVEAMDADTSHKRTPCDRQQVPVVVDDSASAESRLLGRLRGTRRPTAHAEQRARGTSVERHHPRSRNHGAHRVLRRSRNMGTQDAADDKAFASVRSENRPSVAGRTRGPRGRASVSTSDAREFTPTNHGDARANATTRSHAQHQRRTRTLLGALSATFLSRRTQERYRMQPSTSELSRPMSRASDVPPDMQFHYLDPRVSVPANATQPEGHQHGVRAATAVEHNKEPTYMHAENVGAEALPHEPSSLRQSNGVSARLGVVDRNRGRRVPSWRPRTPKTRSRPENAPDASHSRSSPPQQADAHHADVPHSSHGAPVVLRVPSSSSSGDDSFLEFAFPRAKQTVADPRHLGAQSINTSESVSMADGHIAARADRDAETTPNTRTGFSDLADDSYGPGPFATPRGHSELPAASRHDEFDVEEPRSERAPLRRYRLERSHTMWLGANGPRSFRSAFGSRRQSRSRPADPFPEYTPL